MKKKSARVTRLIKRINELFATTGMSAKVLDSDKLYENCHDDEELLIANLEGDIDHIVRGEILREYTFVDWLLEEELIKHFYGKKLSKRKKSHKTFYLILNDLYLIKKLNLIQSYKEIPSKIVEKIYNLNKLRNGYAHKFLIGHKSKSEKYYKGKHDITSPAGLEIFISDMHVITEYFAPWLVKAVDELYRNDTEENVNRS
jgi:hypothetical protein